MCEREKNESLSSPGALFSLKQYSVLWAFLSMVQLLPMSVRCDSDRLRIPVRKALLIIPAGGCVCVCVCVRERERERDSVGLKGDNREGSLHTIVVHFFFPIFQRMFESDF